MVIAVGSFREAIFHLVAFGFQGIDHGDVLQVPVALWVVGIWIVVKGVLNKNADRFLFAFEDSLRVNVAPANVREAADATDHFAKLIGAFPGDVERANGAAAESANGAAFGIFCEVIFPANFGKDFVEEEFGVFVAERIVFDAAVVGIPVVEVIEILHAPGPGSDENSNRHRHLLFGDEIVHHDRKANDAVGVLRAMAVLENEDAGGLGRVVLGGNVNPVIAKGVGEHLALEMDRAFNSSVRNSFLGERIGMSIVFLRRYLGPVGPIARRVGRGRRGRLGGRWILSQGGNCHAEEK